MISDTPAEILKARITFTDRRPVAVDTQLARPYGVVAVAPEPGWFWIAATPRSAQRMRRDGLKVIGTLTQMWVPRQTPGAIDPTCVEPGGEYRPMYDDEDRVIGMRP